MKDAYRCSRCCEVKPRSEFYADKARGSGLCHRCKVCTRAIFVTLVDKKKKGPEKRRTYYLAHRDRIKARNKKYADAHREKLRAYAHEWNLKRAAETKPARYAKHAATLATRDARRAARAAFEAEHLDAIRQAAREKARDRYAKDPAKHRLESVSWQRANPDKRRAIDRKQAAKARATLSDTYLLKLLENSTGVPRARIPAELVEAKRALLKLQRLIQEKRS